MSNRRRFRLHWTGAAGLLAVLAAAATVGVTRAAFSGQAANPGNTFSAAASFGPACTPVTPIWMAGFESGFVSTAGGGLFTTLVTTGGTPTNDSTLFRQSIRSLRIAKTSAGASYAQRTITGSPTTLVGRIVIRLDTLPTANVDLAFVTAGTNLLFGYDSATQKLKLSIGATSVLSATTVQAATWYMLEFRHVVTANPHTVEWRLNEVAQTTLSSAVAASTVSAISFGSSVAGHVFTANYDDVLLTTSAAAHPLGNGRITLLYPNTTTFPVTNFQDNDSTALDANSYSRIDEIMTSTTDFIKQITIGATSFVQAGFLDVPATTCADAVWAMLAYSNTVAGVNSGKLSIFDGATERVVYNGDMNATALTYKSALIAPASAPWTDTALNALVARFGYSGDVTPNPQWHAMHLEYETVPDLSPPAFGISYICPSLGGCATQPGYVKQGNQAYDICVSVTDTGGPPPVGVSFFATHTANMSAISAGVTAGSLLFTGGQNCEGNFGNDLGTLSNASAFVTDAVLPEGNYTYTVTASDFAGNTATSGTYPVVVDNTPPYAVDVQTINKSGGVVGKAEQGDKVVVTWSEPIATYVIWPNHVDSTSAQYCVKITNNGANDTLQVWATACSGTLYRQFGSPISLGGDYVSADTNFGPTSTIVRRDDETWTVTLGTTTGSPLTVGSNTTMTLTADGLAGWCRDSAINYCTAGSAPESGAADVDF